MVYGIIGIGVLLLVAASLSCLRTTRLKRLANTLRWRYDRKLFQPLTEENFAQLLLFRDADCRFTQALTWQEGGAFVRICQVQISYHQEPSARSKYYTLVTVELTRGTFPRLIISYRENVPNKQPNVAQSPLSHYVWKSQKGYVLPPQIIGFLKTGNPCRIETSSTALVYHEYSTIPVSQLQALRFRVMQLVKAFQQEPAPLPKKEPAPVVKEDPTSATMFQAQLLLKMNSLTPTAAKQSSSLGRWIYAILVLLFMGGLGFLAKFLLNQVVAR